MADRYSMTLRDYDREPSTFGFAQEEVTAANFDTISAEALAVQQAVAGVSLGVVANEQTVINRGTSLGAPTDQAAQREIKWFCQMLDTSEAKLFDFEVPCADTSLLQNNDSYLVKYGNIVGNDTGGEITAFRDAIQDLYRSPYGNTATLYNMYLVGRNN